MKLMQLRTRVRKEEDLWSQDQAEKKFKQNMLVVHVQLVVPMVQKGIYQEKIRRRNRVVFKEQISASKNSVPWDKKRVIVRHVEGTNNTFCVHVVCMHYM